MIVCLNGKFVPEETAVVSVLDRGFLYGDSLFETMRVNHGVPFRWADHLDRLKRGAAFLKITLPFVPDQLREWAGQLVEQNQLPEAILRLTVSRGAGGRGYSPAGATKPTLVMTLHPVPESDEEGRRETWRVITSSLRLPVDDPLARFKAGNKLTQVLARAEADAASVDEALLLNTNGEVAEATASNIFCVRGDSILTPPLSSGILPGVTRAVVLELCTKLRINCREVGLKPADLADAHGVFLTLSSRGVVEVESLDGRLVPRSAVTTLLGSAYKELVHAECKSFIVKQ